jgi:cytochrome b561
MTIVFTLATLVVVHVAAVVKHLLVDRTAILRRMLPGGAR